MSWEAAGVIVSIISLIVSLMIKVDTYKIRSEINVNSPKQKVNGDNNSVAGRDIHG